MHIFEPERIFKFQYGFTSIKIAKVQTRHIDYLNSNMVLHQFFKTSANSFTFDNLNSNMVLHQFFQYHLTETHKIHLNSNMVLHQYKAP